MKILFISIKNFRRKLFSLVLAIILWFFVTENSVLVDQKTVDIEYRSLPDNVIMVESLQKLSYTISKNPYYPSDIKSTVKPYVEIADVSPGWHNFPIRLDISPPLPTYANIHPSVTTARVLLDNKSSKTVLVKPDITISNSEDFSVTDIRVTPELTQISGPDSVLQNIKTVFLRTVSISHPGDYKIDAKIDPPAHGVTVQDTKIVLQFSVKSNYQTLSLMAPVVARNLSPNLQLSKDSLPSILLRVRGLSSQISALKDNIKSLLYIDLLNVESKGAYPRIPLKLDIPENITVINARSIPSTIGIFIIDAPVGDENAPSDLENQDTPVENEPSKEEEKSITEDDTTETNNEEEKPQKKSDKAPSEDEALVNPDPLSSEENSEEEKPENNTQKEKESSITEDTQS